jgi:DtxR family Mn-dependent transcriptional regulator
VPKKLIGLSSASVEEYLEAIYSFNENGEYAKNQDLSNKLKVSPPSVTQMVKRLSEEGLVVYTPYKGVFLTGTGRALAEKVVRKHRLLECFLYDVLKMPKERVHDEACRMEHSISDEAAAALCAAMNKPETCPDDGKKIPPCPLDVKDCDACTVSREREGEEFPLLTQLSNLKPGEKGKVAFIRGGKLSSKRIMDMGLTPGTNIKVTNAAPFKGPIEVSVRDTSLALGRGLASHVFIYLEEGERPWGREHPHGPHH